MEILNNKRLLILGGSGFIGSHLADKAVNLGYKVDVISINSPSNKILNKDINYISLDLSNLHEVKNISDLDYEYVVNLSGYINHSNFSQQGQLIVSTHFTAIQIIIEKLIKTKIKRFVQIGSSDEYGVNESPQSENMREDPITPYSFSKTAVTHFLQMLNKTENFPCVILRLFLVYGPRQNVDRLIPQVITGCLENRKFNTSLGNQIRDFCFVDDIVRAIFLSFDEDKVNGKLINIGSGNPVKLRSVIELIKKITTRGQPNIGGFKTTKIENPSLFANIDLSKKILNWEPLIKLEDGLKLTIKYYDELNL